MPGAAAVDASIQASAANARCGPWKCRTSCGIDASGADATGRGGRVDRQGADLVGAQAVVSRSPGERAARPRGIAAKQRRRRPGRITVAGEQSMGAGVVEHRQPADVGSRQAVVACKPVGAPVAAEIHPGLFRADPEVRDRRIGRMQPDRPDGGDGTRGHVQTAVDRCGRDAAVGGPFHAGVAADEHRSRASRVRFGPGDAVSGAVQRASPAGALVVAAVEQPVDGGVHLVAGAEPDRSDFTVVFAGGRAEGQHSGPRRAPVGGKEQGLWMRRIEVVVDRCSCDQAQRVGRIDGQHADLLVRETGRGQRGEIVAIVRAGQDSGSAPRQHVESAGASRCVEQSLDIRGGQHGAGLGPVFSRVGAAVDPSEGIHRPERGRELPVHGEGVADFDAARHAGLLADPRNSAVVAAEDAAAGAGEDDVGRGRVDLQNMDGAPPRAVGSPVSAACRCRAGGQRADNNTCCQGLHFDCSRSELMQVHPSSGQAQYREATGQARTRERRGGSASPGCDGSG